MMYFILKPQVSILVQRPRNLVDEFEMRSPSVLITISKYHFLAKRNQASGENVVKLGGKYMRQAWTILS
jgi:hypothetical protein